MPLQLLHRDSQRAHWYRRSPIQSITSGSTAVNTTCGERTAMYGRGRASHTVMPGHHRPDITADAYCDDERPRLYASSCWRAGEQVIVGASVGVLIHIPGRLAEGFRNTVGLIPRRPKAAAGDPSDSPRDDRTHSRSSGATSYHQVTPGPRGVGHHRCGRVANHDPAWSYCSLSHDDVPGENLCPVAREDEFSSTAVSMNQQICREWASRPRTVGWSGTAIH